MNTSIYWRPVQADKFTLEHDARSLIDVMNRAFGYGDSWRLTTESRGVLFGVIAAFDGDTAPLYTLLHMIEDGAEIEVFAG
jgi:hypothetical protein